MDTKLTIRQQCALVLSTGEATSGVVGPALGSSAQEGHGQTGESPARGRGNG